MEETLHCKRCGARLERLWRFCPACSDPIETPTSKAERRYLTVLFCDMVGSTELSDRLDEDAYQNLITRYHRICADTIDDCEGHVRQYLGDGVVSYFGYPVAREGEGEAVRAVRAALRTIEALKAENAKGELKAAIHVRAGIHTGWAVMSGEAHQRIAIGKTPNVAARLQTLAGVDSVIVSAETARHIEGHFELRPLKLSEVTGKAKASAKELEELSGPEVFHVVRSTGARTKLDAAARGRLTPYVGRESERLELAAAWKQVQRGAARVVVVRGEAGIGKSRVVHDFRRTAQREGGEVFECFCSPLTEASPFAPVIEELNRIARDRAADGPTSSSKLETLGSLLAEHAGLGPDALPLMALLLSIPDADERPIEDMSPGRRRSRTMELLHAWIAARAERAPFVLLVEDVHWADPSTLDLLDRIVRESPGGRTLLLVTARPEFRREWTERHVRTIELTRLDEAEVRSLATDVAGGHPLPPEVYEGIYKRSEGVPLFVEEVTKTVLQSGALRRGVNGYELVGDLDERVLPATVGESLEARVDCLGDSKEIAKYGAAIGREFSYPLISAVANIDEDELRRHLDTLVSSELAAVDSEPPSSSYRFKHALIQDAIYGRPLQDERMQIHGRIFRALKTAKFRDFAAPEMVAHHAERAGEEKEAVLRYLEAGKNAYERTAVKEAVRHLENALRLLSALDTDQRDATEIRIQALIGPAYMSTLGWADPKVLSSSERLRDLTSAALASGGEVSTLGPALYQAMWGLWTVYFLRGELDEALDVARRVHEMAQGTGNPMLKVTGHHAIGYTHFYRGEYEAALRHAADGLAPFDLEPEKALDRERDIAKAFLFSSSCALWCYGAQAHQVLGNVDKAMGHFRGARKLDADLHHAPSRVYLICLCYYHRMAHDIERVRETATTLGSLSVAEGFHFWKLVSDVFLAWADAHSHGDAVAAAATIRQVRREIHNGLTHLVDSEQGAMETEVLLLAGKPEEAFRVAQDALGQIAQGKQRHAETDLFRLQGQAALTMGDTQQAIALFRKGIASARGMGARLLELRCALALARIRGGLEERGDVKRAVDALVGATRLPEYEQALAFLEGRETQRAETR